MAGTPLKVVIVGGGQAGGRLAQALVAEHAAGQLAGRQRHQVTLICAEPHSPYQRPPLSKGILLESATFDDCLIWPPGDPVWDEVDLRVGVSVTAIDRAAKRVHQDDGTALDYDVLVLATGSHLRRLTVPGSDLGNVHSLRTFDQAQEIAQGFAKGKRLMIVGGGFVGLEIAASGRMRDLDTTVVEASDRLLARIVPPRIAGMLAKRHEAAGVTLRMGVMVERFVANGRGAVKAAVLSTGETVPCDVAVVGVGVAAGTELAVAAGLDVDVGIRVDGSLRTSDPAIFACGDVAAFWHPLYERHVRVEAWQNAEDHAAVVAQVILGHDAVADAVPFFWSDQYDLSLQVVGLPSFGSSVVERRQDDGAVLLFHLDALGRLVGGTGLGEAGSIGRDISVTRTLIAARVFPHRADLENPQVRLRRLAAELRQLEQDGSEVTAPAL